MHAYQEEHDVCSSFPWRQLAQSWKVDAGYAQSMVIVIAEDAGQCVLGMDSSSARSTSVSSDEIRLRMCRKVVNEVKVTSTTEHLETFKMECGDGPTLRQCSRWETDICFIVSDLKLATISQSKT